MRIPNRDTWRRLSPWLDDLLDADDTTRARKLAALRAGDAPLARELELLLQASQRAAKSGFLDGNAQDEPEMRSRPPGGRRAN